MALGDLVIGGDDDGRSEVDEAAAAFGLVLDWGGRDAPLNDEFHLWPEHVEAFALFRELQTQWEAGPAGPAGFDYLRLRGHPAVRRVPRDRRESVLGLVSVMERSFMASFADKAKERGRGR